MEKESELNILNNTKLSESEDDIVDSIININRV